MDERLDPACTGARALDKTHQDQDALLVAGSPGQLATVIRRTQDQHIRNHLVTCARCRHFDHRCPECAFDTRRERHGWMCHQQRARWRDIFPWNWRAKKAPHIPAGAAWKHVSSGPTTPRPAPPARRAEAPVVRNEYTPPMAERTASSAPKPRPKPQPLL